MPKLTPYLGPWLAPCNSKQCRQLTEQKDLMNALVDQLPPHDFFLQNCHYLIKNCLPLYWRGFSATIYYTYVFHDLNDLDQVWAGLRDKTRGQIRKAQRDLTVRPEEDIEKILEIQSLTFARQGQALSRDFYDSVRRIDSACVQRKARQIFVAEDEEGHIHGAIYFVWDEDCVYALMSGEDPKMRDSASASLLVWEAIKFASVCGKKFDYCGSIIEPIERFIRNFGGELQPYYSIKRLSRRGQLLMAGRDMLSVLWGN
jgi:hypothetical protein